ncbi:MAG: ATP-binding protein [Candidatus Magasanikbacteria bacterium]|nr:ATP-binding protein [Candidatus Magasanikbacteria bacterium]
MIYNSFSILYLIVFSLNILLGLKILFNNKKNILNKLFATYAFSLAFWNISLFFTITAIGGPTLQLWWSRLAFSFSLILVNVFLYFSLIYPKTKPKNKLFNLFYIIVSLVLFILTLTPLLITNSVIIINGSINGTLGPLINFFTFYYPTIIIITLIILIIKVINSKKIEKIKLAYTTIGFSILVIPILITNLFLPILFNNFHYNNIGPLFSFPMLLIIGYAIVKHRFLDIEVIIKRGFIFSATFVVVATLFIASMLFAGEFIGQTYALVLAAFIITIGFTPFKNSLERITNKIFFKRQYHLRSALEEFNNLLISKHNLKNLLTDTAQKIKDKLQTDDVTFILGSAVYKKFHTAKVFGDKNKIKIEKHKDLVEYISDHKNKEAFIDKNTSVIFKDHLDYLVSHTRIFTNGQRKKLIHFKKAMNKSKFEVISPIYSHKDKKLIAILIIGKKKSDDPFYDKDIRLIDQISKEVVYPIEHSEALRKLQETDKIKTEFINVLSLHLRTPLSSALWDLEILLDGDVGKISKKISSHTSGIHYKLKSLNNGLNSLFTSLEISEKKVAIKKDPNDFFKNLLTPALEKVEEDIEKKGIKIKIKSSQKEITINCDTKKIQQILETLISNAVDYSPKKSTIIIHPSLNVRTDKFTVSVEDEGVGVSTKNKELIFEKFFRGNEIKKIKPEGLGVDLFISRKFAKKHKGQLWCKAKTKKRKGATFILEIPSK